MSDNTNSETGLPESEREKLIPEINLTPEFTTKLNSAGHDIINSIAAINNAVNQYCSRFSSAVNEIRFVPLATQLVEEGFVLDEAESRVIGLNLAQIGTSEILINTVLHALTHATKPPQKVLQVPLMIGGQKVVAFHGLTLKAGLENDSLRLTYFEEGVAEYLALSVKPNYLVPHAGYLALGQLTKAIAQDAGPEAISHLVQTNDVNGFVKLILGIQGEISVENIETLLNFYSSVTANSVTDIANEIKRIRATNLAKS